MWRDISYMTADVLGFGEECRLSGLKGNLKRVVVVGGSVAVMNDSVC
jgi:hypothetical protein